jgi:hypothetical protein
MSKCGYSAVTGAAVALAAATPKTVLAVVGPATFGIDLRKLSVGFDGVTATNTPVLIELCYSTFATAGTNSAVTPAQIYGRATAVGATAARNYTVEPTVLTVIKEYLLTPNGGLVIEEFAPDKGFDSAVSQGFALRCTAAQIVNLRAAFEFERA